MQTERINSYTLDPYMYILFVYHIHCSYTRIFSPFIIHIYTVTSRDYVIDTIIRHDFDEFSCRCYRKMRVGINVERSFPLCVWQNWIWRNIISISSPEIIRTPFFLSSSSNQLSLLIALAFYWPRLLCVSHSILLSSLQT